MPLELGIALMDGEVIGGSIGSGCETPRMVSGRVVGLRAGSASEVLLARLIFVSGSSEQETAIAVASKEAVGKRVAGSFAMARRRITPVVVSSVPAMIPSTTS